MINNTELDFEISRIQQLMEVQNSNRNLSIKKANELINGLSKTESLWPEKVNIIGYLIILLDETSKNKYETKKEA